jgi:AcrR family transcriptional regulator
MARRAKEDYLLVMMEAAGRRLQAGEDVRVADIAAELGVTPGLVHFYFGDRRSLEDAAWRELIVSSVHEDLAAVAEIGAHQDWDAVRALIGEVLTAERSRVRETHLRGTVEGRRSPELAEVLAEEHERTIGAWEALISHAIDEGIASTALSPRAIAALVVAVPLGLTAILPEMDEGLRNELAEAWTAMLRAVLDVPPAAGSDG